MLDFVQVKTSTKVNRRGGIEESVILVYPEFTVCQSEDLMVRGGAFYAVWDEENGTWCKDAGRIVDIVDRMLYDKRNEFPDDVSVNVKSLRNYSSQKWDEFLRYCRAMPDNFHELDSTVVFANDAVQKSDYSSHRLNYALKPGKMDAYEELVSTLYEPIERRKIEWAVGSVISGDSKKIQKFLVLYGSAGSGKSTILNIIQMLFDGYYNVFDAKALASANDSFALEMFKDNPLVSIQHDGDLSRIEDNTRLNSIVSHEEMVVNEKRKSRYSAYFHTFLFMGTNKPVKITDSRSGITRRLIDVRPSGDTVPFDRYQVLMAQIGFELGAIASHCLKVYLDMGGMDAYNAYRPYEMMGATNDFYNFMEDHYDIFAEEGGTTLTQAWALYKRWVEDAAVKYPMSKRALKEELKGYFKEFRERTTLSDRSSVRNVYSIFLTDKFAGGIVREPGKDKPDQEGSRFLLDIQPRKSNLDKLLAEMPAQLANSDGTPALKWSSVTTKLKDIDTSELHYVKLPPDHIVIDFDLKDENGEKSLERNLRAASKWPTTYAELSKSGKGVHLHYTYSGDVKELASVYSDGIEIKRQVGNSALRRKLTRCTDSPVEVISSGLPLKKGGKKVIDFEGLKNEKQLRALIEKNLRKEVHPATKPSIDFIYKILCDAYSSGMSYDVSDMRTKIMSFANNSTHNALYCMKMVSKMPFHSEEPSEPAEWGENELIFFDVEVFPNLFVIVWKREGDSKPVQMINPTPTDVEILLKYRLVGFNNRRYDNHILYGRVLGFSNKQLYAMSKNIISGGNTGTLRQAYGISYADVYDFASKKQSLKKWEIELGIHHQELGLPWDDPVSEDLWPKVAEYCVNDVIATEAVFKARHEDFMARSLLADISGLRINDTTRQHATRIIFGNDKTPQDKFVYTDLSEMFPGYEYSAGVSTYRGEEVGEGGYVYSEPGMYSNVALLDIRSMHPHSLIALNLFGDEYTQRFKELLDARVAIKQKDYATASKLLDGKLKPYLSDVSESDKLAYALKIIINSVYGYTAAKFDCEFKDPRNVDNIVAKRGALFMVDLKHAIQERGYSVCHIKTDSVKIPEADSEIIEFVKEFGEKYGYFFEHEATYDKLCLVNDAVYICKDPTGKWHATGTQFAVPYVFKTLFSHEDLCFTDFCETKAVRDDSALYLDMNEADESDHSYRFVGRAGSFCPILPGRGGGLLMRFKDGKYYAAAGTKGFRWLEAETVQKMGKEDDIDTSYYDKLADEAIETISKYGDFSKFVK